MELVESNDRERDEMLLARSIIRSGRFRSSKGKAAEIAKRCRIFLRHHAHPAFFPDDRLHATHVLGGIQESIQGQEVKGAALAINRDDASGWADEAAESNRVRTDVRADVDDGIRRPDEQREKIKFLFRPFAVMSEGCAN